VLIVERVTASEASRSEYESVAEVLAGESGAVRGQMMGMPTLYLGGKAFAGLWGDAMVFKLEGDDHAAALALEGAALFDPSGIGRPMKAWVRVPVARAAEWPRLARAGARTLLAVRQAGVARKPSPVTRR
jgi:hypothetical protein